MLALTPTQTDELIKIVGKLIENVPQLLSLFATLLTMCASGFLILRQYLNNRNLGSKMDTGIAISHEVKQVALEAKAEAKGAFVEANNVNVKLASIGIQTKPQLAETEQNPMPVTDP